MMISSNTDVVLVPRPKVVLCDIEGTTTAITYVKDVLFPYARQNVRSFLETNWYTEQTKADIALLWQQYMTDRNADEQDLPSIDQNFCFSSSSIDSIVNYVFWQMDRDKKTTALKQLQGNIWLNGYENKKLIAHVYDDVPTKFQQWTTNNIKISIYSSGSVLAQKLLFGHTKFGDLNEYISSYFDTKVGAKRMTESYQKIITALDMPANEVLFLTDIREEATAAIAAGMNSIILKRDSFESSVPCAEQLKHVNNFNQIIFENQ